MPLSQLKYGQNTDMSILTITLKGCLCHFSCSGHGDAFAVTSVNFPAPSLVSGEREAAPRGNSEQQTLITFSELPFLGTLCVLADRPKSQGIPCTYSLEKDYGICDFST